MKSLASFQEKSCKRETKCINLKKSESMRYISYLIIILIALTSCGPGKYNGIYERPIPQPPVEDHWAKWTDEINELPDSIKQYIGFGGYPQFKIPDNMYQDEIGEWHTREDNDSTSCAAPSLPEHP